VPGAGNFPAYAYDGATGTEVTSLDLVLDAYTIINLSAGIVADDWSATLYIHNVGDEEADLSFNRERGGLARTAFFVNRPRTIGLTFRKSWGD
jgi:outer membrane receptor protein involved in Fe transport